MLGVAYGSRSRVESDMKFTHKHHARHAFCGTKAQFGVIQLESMNWADVPTRASHAEGRWFDHSQDHEVRRLGGGPRRTSLRIAYLPSPACPVANCGGLPLGREGLPRLPRGGVGIPEIHSGSSENGPRLLRVCVLAS